MYAPDCGKRTNIATYRGAGIYLKRDYIYITEQNMPVELQKLLKYLKLQSRDGMVVTSSLLRGIHLHRTSSLVGC